MQKVLDKLSWLLLAFFIFYLDFSLQGVLLVRKNLRHIEADVMASLGFILVTIFIVLLLRLLKEPLSLKPLATTKFALYLQPFLLSWSSMLSVGLCALF